MSKKIKLIIGLVVILFISTVLGLSKVEAAEVTEKQTKQLSKGKVEVITETKKVNGEEVEILKDVNLDFSAKTKGDVNGDGIVSVEDASYLLMKTVADTLKDETKLSSDESNYADIDSDGMITVKDAQYVLTYYAKKAAGLNPTWEQVVNEADSEVNDNNSSDTSYEKDNTDQIRKTGIEGYYKNGDKQFTVYAQGYNDVWGSMPYWNSDYANSAAGITSVATILSGFGVNKNPVDVNNDGIITNGDTLPSQLTDQFGKYSLYCSDPVFSSDVVIANLKKGNPVLVNLHNATIGNNKYKDHYVALLGMSDDGKIFLADPAGGGNNTGYFEQDKILPALDWCVVISTKKIKVSNASSRFFEVAREMKEKIATDGYTYGMGDPIMDKQVNCASYVALSLYNSGTLNAKQNNSLLINSATQLKKALDNGKYFLKTYDGKTLNVDEISLQPGDIVFEGGDNSEDSIEHVQIYAGKNSNGENVWYNCGDTTAMEAKPGEDTFSNPSKDKHYITYVYRKVDILR